MKFLSKYLDTILYICGATALFLNGMVFKGPIDHVLIGILLVFIFRFGFILGDYCSFKNQSRGRR